MNNFKILTIIFCLLFTNNYVLAAQKTIKIGSGSILKGYYFIGLDLCRTFTLADNNINCEVIPTKGTVDNLNLLKEGKIDLALVQSSVALEAYEGIGYFAKIGRMQENAIDIPFESKESYNNLLKSLKYNEYKSSLYIYDKNLSDLDATRRINFTKKWVDIEEINIFKYNFKEKTKQKLFSDLFKSLKFNTNVKLLLLDGIALGDESMKCLGSCLKINTSVTYLTLYKNDIGPKGAFYLSEALLENEVLESLLLENNLIGPKGTKYFCEALKKNKSLTTFVLRGNKIGDKGAENIGDMLNINKSLQAIGLGNNEITEKGFYFISEGLKFNTILAHLWLGENKLGNLGAKYISEVLKSKKSRLNSIWVNGNSILNEGAYYIAEAIKENQTIQTLTLDKNMIECAGLSSIANSLKYNNTIRNLWLDGNKSDDEVIRNFADAIKFSDSIETLWINGDNISWSGYDYFAEMLKINDSIKNIIIGGEKINLENFERFQNIINKINLQKRSFYCSIDNSNSYISYEKVDKNINLCNRKKEETSFSYEENSLNEKKEKLINSYKLNDLKYKKISEIKRKRKEFEDSKENEYFYSLEHNIILNDSKKFIKKTDNLTKIKSNNNEKCHPNQKENIQLQIQINQNENLFNEISVEKCYKSFNYLKLMESIFLKCLKCKKIFDDGNLSFIEKNFVDQIIIDNENMLNNQDFFDSEEFNIKDLQIGKKKEMKK